MRLFAVFVLLSSLALADIAPDPASVASDGQAMEEARDVAMKGEVVTIELHDLFAVVDATFVLANSGEATRLEVGFPGAGVLVGERYAAHRPLVGFTAWVAGAQVEAAPREKRHEWKMGPEGREYTKSRTEIWHVFPVEIPTGGETTVRVRYGVLADPHRGDSWSSDDALPDSTVSYVLATGAGWKGSIGEATFRIVAKGSVRVDSVRVRDGGMPEIPTAASASDAIAPSLPEYGRIEDGGVVLLRRELEPTKADDLEIVYRSSAPDRPKGYDLYRLDRDPEVAKRIEEAVAAAK